MSTSGIEAPSQERTRKQSGSGAYGGSERPSTAPDRESGKPAPASKTGAPSSPSWREKLLKSLPASKRARGLVAAGALAVVGVALWLIFSGPALPPGFAGGNGRLEANQIYIATKYAGRVKDVLFNEGDTVEAGQVVAHMDTSALDAQLKQALAQITEAQDSRKVALAQVAVRQATYNYAEIQNKRSRRLVPSGAVSAQEAEIDAANAQTAQAELVGAQSEAVRTLASIEAAKATADRLRAEIKDSVLVSPIRLRIETRLAEPGEVLGAGGRVFSTTDLSDVYMYVFLPESATGKITLGSEARIVLDSAAQYPIRAYVSFVSPTAQFTPKTVETEQERHALTFRVKLQIDKNRLRQFESLVKSGVPGMGYVRYDLSAQWPESLQPKSVVPKNLWNPTGSVPSR